MTRFRKTILALTGLLLVAIAGYVWSQGGINILTSLAGNGIASAARAETAGAGTPPTGGAAAGSGPNAATGGRTSITNGQRAGAFGPISAWEFGTISFGGSYNATVAAANRTAIQAAITFAISRGRQVVQLPCGNSSGTGGVIWLDQTIYVDAPNNHVSVTGAANNGAGAIRLTVTSTAGWSTGNIVAVYGVGGTLEANSNLAASPGQNWTIAVIDGTHVDLQGSRFVNAYSGGGTVYNSINSNFSALLRGCGGQANNNAQGSILSFAKGLNAPYVVVGGGQGVGIEGLTVQGSQSAACPAAYPPQSIGIAYAGGPGGGTRFELTDVGVFGAYDLINIGFSNNSLADRTVLNKVFASDGYYGLYTSETQAFMIDVNQSSFAAAYAFYNAQNLNININGGGHNGPIFANVFGISGLSKLSPAGLLTTTVTSPDSKIAFGCYNSFVIKTADFGPVPFTLSSFNPVTKVVTLRLLGSWLGQHFGNVANLLATNIDARLQAATSLYAVERSTVFYGAGYNVSGVHIEGSQPITLVDTIPGGASQMPSHFSMVRMNADPACSNLAWSVGTGSSNEARFLICQTFPFMNLGPTPFTLEHFYPGTAQRGDPFIIDAYNPQQVDYNFRNIAGVTPFATPSPVLRWWAYGNNDDAEQYAGNRYRGDGYWDRDPWLPRQIFNCGSSCTQLYMAGADNRVPFKGYRPDPNYVPRLTPNQYNQVSGTLPTLGTYPLIHGGTIYQVSKEGITTPPMLVNSAHQFYSWGQNLTYPWRYLGGSNWITMGVDVAGAVNNGRGACRLTVSSTSGLSTNQQIVVRGVRGATGCNGSWKISVVDGTRLDLQGTTFGGTYVTTTGAFVSDTSAMFSGLSITLNLDGTNYQFVVTGVFPSLGGITVSPSTPITPRSDVAAVGPGIKTTVYTGTTIIQQPYSWNVVKFQ